MFGSFELALNESFVDHNFGCNIRELALLPHLHLLAHGLDVALHSVDAIEMQSISENDFEYFAKTSVNTPSILTSRQTEGMKVCRPCS